MKKDSILKEYAQIAYDNAIYEAILGKESYFVRNMSGQTNSSSSSWSELLQQNQEMAHTITKQEKKIKEQAKKIEEQNKKFIEQDDKIKCIERMLTNHVKIWKLLWFSLFI